MPPEDISSLWDATRDLQRQMAITNVVLAEIKTILSERHHAMGREIGELKDAMRSNQEEHSDMPCRVHHERLKTLERVVWGVCAAVGGLLLKASWDILRLAAGK